MAPVCYITNRVTNYSAVSTQVSENTYETYSGSCCESSDVTVGQLRTYSMFSKQLIAVRQLEQLAVTG